MRWLITNRNVDEQDGFGCTFSDLTYWTRPDGEGDIASRATWTSVTALQFKGALIQTAAAFPNPLTTDTAAQKHVSLFIHGYNNNWSESILRYRDVCSILFDGANSMGELISFDWPSRGSLLGYLPDRGEARQTGDDLTEILSDLYDWALMQQIAATQNPQSACRARTSIIAHSMGNYALQYAMNAVWTRKNRPLLTSLMQEVLMIAADVDNDIFRAGEQVQAGAGEGLANLSYRITALYTGRDDVLGSAAGLKHFGKRRLGRSGLDRTYAIPDNVWDVDCSRLLSTKVNGIAVHGEYFNPAEAKVYTLMRGILSGNDRSVLIDAGHVPTAMSRVQLVTAPA